MMALFYRGAGIGTPWHINVRNPKITGFNPWNPGGVSATCDRILQHVGNANTQSPYVSLTRSFHVAWSYAIAGKTGMATSANPGYVYEIELTDHDLGSGKGLELIDPVKEIAAALIQPNVTPSYQHDGDQNLLLGIVGQRRRFRRYLTMLPLQPPGLPGPNPARVSLELRTFTRALRDAEILAVGNIPASCVKQYFPAC